MGGPTYPFLSAKSHLRERNTASPQPGAVSTCSGVLATKVKEEMQCYRRDRYFRLRGLRQIDETEPETKNKILSALKEIFKLND
jgi:hypothetical protein